MQMIILESKIKKVKFFAFHQNPSESIRTHQNPSAFDKNMFDHLTKMQMIILKSKIKKGEIFCFSSKSAF